VIEKNRTASSSYSRALTRQDAGFWSAMFEAVPLSGHTWREAVAGVPRHFEIVAGRPTLKDTPGDDFRAALALASLARRLRQTGSAPSWAIRQR
jgi:hypothetical protein